MGTHNFEDVIYMYQLYISCMIVLDNSVLKLNMLFIHIISLRLCEFNHAEVGKYQKRVYERQLMQLENK
jgi:hypothetical protein